MIYYEVENKKAPQEGLPNGVVAFDTLEEAIQFADENECELISQIGGNYDEFAKCWFCGDWFPLSDLIGTGVCERCAVAIRDHEGGEI
jgi:hypothetical protein